MFYREFLCGSGIGKTIQAYFTWQIRRELQQVHCELQEQRLQRQKLQEELDRLKAMVTAGGSQGWNMLNISS